MKKNILPVGALLAFASAVRAATPDPETIITDATGTFELAAAAGILILGVVIAIKLVRKFVK